MLTPEFKPLDIITQRQINFLHNDETLLAAFHKLMFCLPTERTAYNFAKELLNCNRALWPTGYGCYKCSGFWLDGTACFDYNQYLTVIEVAKNPDVLCAIHELPNNFTVQTRWKI